MRQFRCWSVALAVFVGAMDTAGHCLGNPFTPPNTPTLTLIDSAQATSICTTNTLSVNASTISLNNTLSATNTCNSCGACPISSTLYTIPASGTYIDQYTLTVTSWIGAAAPPPAAKPTAPVDTVGLSVLDNASFNYHHTAYDYRSAIMPSGSTGCSSCGGGADGVKAAGAAQVMPLLVERRHRYRDQANWQSSFGPGVFSNFDMQLALYASNLTSGGTASAYAPTVELFDPHAAWPIRLTVPTSTGNLPADANGDGTVDINDLTIVLSHYGSSGAAWSQGEFTGDGTVDINDLTMVLANYGSTYQTAYQDQTTNAVPQLALYSDAPGASNPPTHTHPTWTIETANLAVVTDYNGTKRYFDIFPVSPTVNSGGFADPNNNLGAVGWWKLNDGITSAGTTAAADSSGGSHGGTLSITNGSAFTTTAPGAVQLYTGDYVSIPDTAGGLNISGQVTMAVWVYLSAAPTDNTTHYIVCSGDNHVYLGITGNNGGSVTNQWTVGDSTTSSALVSVNIGPSDIGNWMHLAGVYDGNRWKIYRNGTLSAVSGSVSGYSGPTTTGGWVIGANGPPTGPTGNYLAGMVNNFRLYNRALSAKDIRTVSVTSQYSGRLRYIQNRNLNATTITYTYNPWDTGNDPFHSQTVAAAITADPTVQWRIRTITDPYGRTITIDNVVDPNTPTSNTPGYTQPTAGIWKSRWEVSSITLPDGHQVTYAYYDPTQPTTSTLHCGSTDLCCGMLGQVTHPDGSLSTFSIPAAFTSPGNLLPVTIVDPMADGGHTSKTAYFTNQLALTNLPTNPWLAEIFNQSSWMVRMLTNSGGSSPEVTYLNYCVSSGTSLIYQGQGDLMQIIGSYSAQYYPSGNWSVNSSGGTTTIATTGSGESTYAMLGTYAGGTASYPPTSTEFNRGTCTAAQDAQGRTYSYTYNSAGEVLTWTCYNTSGTAFSSKSWAYDMTKPNYPMTRYTDQLGEQTSCGYDTNGNLTSMQVGIVSGVNQPEYACYQWAYCSSGGTATLPDGTTATQPANYLQYAYYPVTSVGTFGDYMLCVYDSSSRLAGIQEPDDTGTTYHWAYAYTYLNSAGQSGYDELATVMRVNSAGLSSPGGYITTYSYDSCNRVCKVTYGDSSTEEYLYGTNAGAAGTLGTNNAAGQLLAFKDRNGYVTDCSYDLSGRLQQKTVAKYYVTTSSSSIGTILGGSYPPSPPYPPEASATTYSYLNGTGLPSRVIANSATSGGVTTGQTARYTYDYRHRRVGQAGYPIYGTPLWSEWDYYNNQLFYTREPYGTHTYFDYRDADGVLTCAVKETSVGAAATAWGTTTPTPSNLRTFDTNSSSYGPFQSGSSSINGSLLVTLYGLDSAGQVTSMTDPRGVGHSTTYDSRGRATDRYDDTAGANAHTQTIYNIDNTVQEVNSRRYYATSDTNGHNRAYETFQYTRRRLRASHVVDPAVTAATEYLAYNSDRTLYTHVDFNNTTGATDTAHTWTTFWSACCAGRQTQQVAPPVNLSGGTGASNQVVNEKAYDFAGNVTCVQRLGLVGSTSSAAANLVATRYDGRRRPVAQTVWLTIPSSFTFSDTVQSPPIAGALSSDPPVTYSGGTAINALTTQWIYVDNLVAINTSGGSSYPVTFNNLGGSSLPSTCTFDLSPLLNATGLPLGPGEPAFGNFNGFSASGSAVITVNPLGEISASVADATGRTIASGVFKQDTSGSASLITTSLIRNDLLPINPTTYVAVPGAVVETDRVVYTVLGGAPVFETTRSYTDGAGRVLQTLDALTNATTMSYDPGGNMVSVRDPNGVGWDASKATAQPISSYSGSYEGYDGFDALGRLTNRIDTQGDRTQTGYDLNGNVTSTVGGNSIVAGTSTTVLTTLQYDARDRNIQKTDRISGVTTWTYDNNSNLLTMIDPDNQSSSKATVWTYNARNQKITETYPDSSSGSDVKQFDYDNVGRSGTLTNQNGETIGPTYDMADRLTYRAYTSSGGTSPAATDSFVYDDARRLLTATSGLYNNVVACTYTDGAGRKTSESLTIGGAGVTYNTYSAYDAAGNRKSIWYPDNTSGYSTSSPTNPSVARTYTPRNQVDEIDYYNGATSTTNMAARYAINSSGTWTPGYDNGGRRIARTLGDSLGTATSWSYRTDNLVSQIQVNSGGAPVPSFTYSRYDHDKNELSESIGSPMTNYGFGDVAFWVTTYDNEDRLLGWFSDETQPQRGQAWQLSKAGDWPGLYTWNGTGYNSQTRRFNPVHEMTRVVGSTPPTYDAKGNMTGDPSGQTYAWDFNNRMTSAMVGANTYMYAYDALGRRVAKSAANGTWTSAAYTVFIMDGPKEVAEYSLDPTTSPSPTSTPQRKFVWGASDLVLISNVTFSGGTATETIDYYHQNNRNSVEALSDASGNVQVLYAYTPYGQVTFFNGSGAIDSPQPTALPLGNPFLYDSYYYDIETGLYYTGSQYYNPSLGRFMSRDPIEAEVNLYEYASDDPLALWLTQPDATSSRPNLASGGFLMGISVPAGRCAAVGWKDRTPSQCDYPDSATYEADFTGCSAPGSGLGTVNGCYCAPLDIRNNGGGDMRVSWPINCVCKHMSNSPFANCVRGCLHCIYEQNGRRPQSQKDHTWCFDQCAYRVGIFSGYVAEWLLYRQLLTVISCCAVSQGTIVGPATGGPPGPGTPAPTRSPANYCPAGAPPCSNSYNWGTCAGYAGYVPPGQYGPPVPEYVPE
jgi:RHS repeat-associated protein